MRIYIAEDHANVAGAKALIFVLSLIGHHDRKTWGCFHSSVANSVAHSTACVIYILFNDIHTSHALQKPENYEAILENLRFSIQSLQVGSPRYSYGDAVAYVADVIRVRCGCVLNASLRVE